MICIFKLYHLLVKICIHLIDDNNAYRLLIAVLQLHASIQSFNGAEGNIKKKRHVEITTLYMRCSLNFLGKILSII